MFDKIKPFLSLFGLLFCIKGSHYATQHLARGGHVVLLYDTLSKMTLLHFLAIQLTELNPTKTLYWARNGHFSSLILGDRRSMMLLLLVLTLSGGTL